MSGGSHDYAFSHVYSMADVLKRSHRSDRRAFGLHLENVAQAMHDIEWVDSGDYAEDGDVASIKACLSDEMTEKVLQQNVSNAQKEFKKCIAEFLEYQKEKTTRKDSPSDLNSFC